ncbi:MAG: MAPEG family protein [Aestuariivirga sp.]|uniref:MAPEG family protein n=1 Tax=Aestuariivirga sp. TaxID=2650926 RepID=UPI0025C65B6E|nr:MAPEG family protein [Aestuariivirga sp.]MCA3559787.1 MAPEG family protein [Aestuariivirga sp.]
MTIVQWLLLPAFVHVAWIVALGLRMGRARMKAVMSGKVKLADVALDSSRWPDDVRKLANNYDNQFQVPVLFYALLPLLIQLAKVDWLTVALAWVFAASRIVHSLVHTGSNVVIRRGQAFLVGYGAVALMWAWFALRLYAIG